MRVHLFSRSFALSPKLKGTCNVSGFMPGESIQSVPVIFILTRREMTSIMLLLFHILGGRVFFCFVFVLFCCCFFFQAEDGIRDVERSRGLGDVYKRQFVYSAQAK